MKETMHVDSPVPSSPLNGLKYVKKLYRRGWVWGCFTCFVTWVQLRVNWDVGSAADLIGKSSISRGSKPYFFLHKTYMVIS